MVGLLSLNSLSIEVLSSDLAWGVNFDRLASLNAGEIWIPWLSQHLIRCLVVRVISKVMVIDCGILFPYAAPTITTVVSVWRYRRLALVESTGVLLNALIAIQEWLHIEVPLLLALWNWILKVLCHLKLLQFGLTIVLVNIRIVRFLNSFIIGITGDTSTSLLDRQ